MEEQIGAIVSGSLTERYLWRLVANLQIQLLRPSYIQATTTGTDGDVILHPNS